MQRASYIRFVEAVMTPGRGGNTISKAHAIELDDDGKPKPSTQSRDELMTEILVGNVAVCLRNAKGARYTPLYNVKDYELIESDDAAEPQQKEKPRK